MELTTKIFWTAALAFILSSIAIGAVDKGITDTRPGLAFAVVLLLTFFGSALTIIGCLFAWIWI